jgi:hypothetical protein
MYKGLNSCPMLIKNEGMIVGFVRACGEIVVAAGSNVVFVVVGLAVVVVLYTQTGLFKNSSYVLEPRYNLSAGLISQGTLSS